MDTLRDLLVEEVQDLYSAETQLVKALPKLAEKASNSDLRAAINKHLHETEGHVRRLEQVAEQLQAKPSGRKCKGMEGLLDEGDEMMSKHEAGDMRDAGLIGAAQRVEHYEMAGYGTARTHAQQLGLNNLALLLQQTLNEEAAANDKLTQLAESHINAEAVRGGNGGKAKMAKS